MRLIDADELRKQMYHQAFETDTDMQRWDSGCWIRYKMFENAIESAPTVDPVKHGRWTEMCVLPITETFIESVRETKCTNCQKWHTMPYHYGAEDYEFCPHCGARMDL